MFDKNVLVRINTEMKDKRQYVLNLKNCQLTMKDKFSKNNCKMRFASLAGAFHKPYCRKHSTASKRSIEKITLSTTSSLKISLVHVTIYSIDPNKKCYTFPELKSLS